MLDLDATASSAFPPLTSFDVSPTGASAASPTPPRKIVPRRPLRLSPRSDDRLSDPREALPVLNIFADVFDDTGASPPFTTVDPRLAASRHRMRRALDRSLRSAAPDAANFWHDTSDNGPPSAARCPADAFIVANDRPDLPLPLWSELARVRAALYAEGPDEDAGGLDDTTPVLRLASHTMNATLVVAAPPVGAAMLLYGLVRGGNIRMSTRAMALTATVLGVLQSGMIPQLFHL